MHTAHTHPSFRSFGSSAILAAPYTIHSPKTNHQISSSKSSTKALIHRTTQYALYPCKRETTQRRWWWGRRGRRRRGIVIENLFRRNKRVDYPNIYIVLTAHTLGASSIKLMTMITHNEDYHELNRIGGIAKRVRTLARRSIWNGDYYVYMQTTLSDDVATLRLFVVAHKWWKARTHIPMYKIQPNIDRIPNSNCKPNRIGITFIKINYYILIIKANFFAHWIRIWKMSRAIGIEYRMILGVEGGNEAQIERIPAAHCHLHLEVAKIQ